MKVSIIGKLDPKVWDHIENLVLLCKVWGFRKETESILSIIKSSNDYKKSVDVYLFCLVPKFTKGVLLAVYCFHECVNTSLFVCMTASKTESAPRIAEENLIDLDHDHLSYRAAYHRAWPCTPRPLSQHQTHHRQVILTQSPVSLEEHNNSVKLQIKKAVFHYTADGFLTLYQWIMEQLGDDDHLKEPLHVCLLCCLQPPLQQTTGKTRCVKENWMNSIKDT